MRTSLERSVASIVCLLFSFLSAGATANAQVQVVDRYREARLRMVENELVREGITQPAVLESMRSVPRHQFVSAEFRPMAYFDAALPIGHKQTISPPFIVAYMTQSLDPQPTDKVLEIGTGSGYQAAVLSGIVKEVYTIEIVEPLGKNAAKVLKEQGYTNVRTLIGDGYKGWPEHAPFDKIIVTCSPEQIPVPLVEQLKEGGRMIVPLGERYSQVFYLLEKKNSELIKKKLLPALFVPMTGISEENRQILPDPLKPAVRNGSFEMDTDADGYPDGWHYQRQNIMETDNAPDGRVYMTFHNADVGRGAQMLQGMALDGSKISSVQISLFVRGQNLKSGPRPYERPSLILHYFDADRKPVGEETIGPWTGTFAWRKAQATLQVPAKAREAIIRIGLNGATGSLSVDDIRLVPQIR